MNNQEHHDLHTRMQIQLLNLDVKEPRSMPDAIYSTFTPKHMGYLDMAKQYWPYYEAMASDFIAQHDAHQVTPDHKAWIINWHNTHADLLA